MVLVNRTKKHSDVQIIKGATTMMTCFRFTAGMDCNGVYSHASVEPITKH